MRTRSKNTCLPSVQRKTTTSECAHDAQRLASKQRKKQAYPLLKHLHAIEKGQSICFALYFITYTTKTSPPRLGKNLCVAIMPKTRPSRIYCPFPLLLFAALPHICPDHIYCLPDRVSPFRCKRYPPRMKG